MAAMPFRHRMALLGLLAPIAAGCGSSSSAPAAAPSQDQVGGSIVLHSDSPLSAWTRDVRLPGAVNAREVITDAPVVSVVGTEVRLDGKVVADTGPILAGHRMMRVDGLFTALAARREAWKQDPAHAGATFPGVVMIAFPDDAIAIVVKSVFQTAAFAGFPNAAFLVGGPNGIGRLDVDAQIPMPSGSGGNSGGLTQEQIRRVVGTHTDAVGTCYTLAAQRNPSLGAGTLTLSWKIDPQGAVKDASIVSSELKSRDLESCVLRQIRSWVFPSSTTPTVIDSFPFRFGVTH